MRDLLGLADADTVVAYGRALATGDPLAGIAVLDGLEERGRDLRSFADQVVDALRGALHAALAGRPSADALADLGAGPLAGAARRLAAIDPARPGPGGIRLALELALFEPAALGLVPLAVAPAAAGERPPVRPSEDAGPAATARPRRAVPAPAPPPPAVEPAPPPPAVEPAPAPAEETGPAAPGSPAPATPPPAPDDGDALAELRRHWPEIVALVSRHPPTKPLIEACRPIAVDGVTVTLGFPESQLFLRDVADRRRGTLEDGLGRVLGRAVTVRCVATNLEPEPPPASDPESAAVLRAARDVWGDDLVEIPEVH